MTTDSGLLDGWHEANGKTTGIDPETSNQQQQFSKKQDKDVVGDDIPGFLRI
ncbi:uncharacterized protein BYT42DRAFT_616408 [Radiomyces spectabilis]|uniref:uncharacterized protein n=1 Tax=Radiomyces spectabilis TaxID=64574 RepID=UPI002220668A|nr:uncharacterized protein BYT42DRAFT_616408 [Radiomyces spectabilis]KAI8373241.1 hypothetical protein BYT42DRAFT_616408 [Radiomyces spectabilis]